MSARGPQRLLALLAIVALAGACSGQRATFGPARSASAGPLPSGQPPSASGAPSTSSSPTPSPTSTPEPPPFDPAHVSVTLQSIVKIAGRAVTIANAGDGSNRLFVADQGGRVFVIRDGKVLGTPMLDIRDQTSDGGEEGLLGLAFHPDFPTDGRVFVYYTNNDRDIVISSFDVTGGADSVVRGSEQVILTVDHGTYGNHNGGGLLFGPDGYLYAATGDGGGGGDPFGSGQDLNTLLGKILRIDIDGGDPYAIPADNPFVSQGGARPEIWLTGLRNPFRISFDRSNGDLWIGDVGQNKWEEIDVARRGQGGLNYGWNVMEGAHCYKPASGCSQDGLTLPVAVYGHDLGVAVIGGYVYRGPQAVLNGAYLYSDNYSGRIWALTAAGDGAKALVQVGQGAVGVAGYGEAERGELYAADLDGTIWRVVGKAR